MKDGLRRPGQPTPAAPDARPRPLPSSGRAGYRLGTLSPPLKRFFLFLVLAVGAGALGQAIQLRLSELSDGGVRATGERIPVPVQVGTADRGRITLRRTFSGTLEAAQELIAAPKVAGRLQRLEVDLGDIVERGQIVAWLDDDELVQAVREAEASLAVAHASQAEARSALEIAERALQRAKTLREEGVTSDSQLDAARSEELASRAHVQVTDANVARAEAALEGARIRSGYARVTADWTGGDDKRVVAERFIDEGGTVSPNGALLSIVELDPIVAVVFVPERDYARLRIGQRASISTDAYPERVFDGEIVRIAPIFRRSTRQARIELIVDNPDEALKPGMFVRAVLELEHAADAVSVPFDAIAERGGHTGVFSLDDTGEPFVSWRPVELGIREGARVQVFAEGLTGHVVTLGQELCDDGSRVSVIDDER